MLARALRKAALLLCLLAAASAQEAAPLQVKEVALDPFVEVDACLPINVLIQPNASTDAYSLMLEAEAAVLDALSFQVTDSVLRLGNTANFNTSRPIKIVVTMPQGELQAINHQGTGAEVFVSQGFNVHTFVASTSFGAGRLYVDGMMAQNATLLLSGTGDAVLLGSFGTVNATSTGTGGLFISGANDTVQLDLLGVADAFVQPGLPTTAITGTAQGINTVQYTDGTCAVRSSFAFLQVCQAVPFVAIPAPSPIWTCGLQVQGRFQCSNQGTSFTSSGGFVGTSGGTGTTPITTTTPSGVSAFTPSSFQFSGASPAGPSTGTQQQAGAVTPSGTTAASNIAGTGSVSATSVAGPSGGQTSTTQNGATTGQQTTGGMTSSATASSSSTAFSTASPASTEAVTAPQTVAATQGGQASSGVIRVGADGMSQATATSQACVALARELRMPFNSTQA